jgi:AraC family transcriptional regulator of arabinose operon
MATRRKYLNYTTPWGVDLARVATAGWTPFLIHESGYQPALENWNHQGVDSPFWRFYYNPKPGCHLIFQGRQIPLEPKKAVLIPADTVFDCVGPVRACHYWLHFTTNRPGVSFSAEPMLFPVDDTMRDLLSQLIDTHQSSTDGHRLLHLASALLHVVFAKLDSPAQTLPERLSEVLALIARSPHTKLTNHFLAERAGMSVERFIRSFREHTGQTPAAYVLATRSGSPAKPWPSPIKPSTKSPSRPVSPIATTLAACSPAKSAAARRSIERGSASERADSRTHRGSFYRAHASRPAALFGPACLRFRFFEGGLSGAATCLL